ncbi:MAG: thioredoxin domain-containing protein [Halobacteriales archaeon]
MFRPTRRALLVGAGASLGGALAGCLGDDGGGDTVDDLPVPTVGADDAPVTLEVYVDFSCPHCRSFEMEVLPQLRENYIDPEVARYRHRDYPIPVDERWSWEVASGMRAVQDEAGDAAFFEAAAAIFEHQGEYSYGAIETVGDEAADVGEAARDAAEAETYRPVVESDREHGDDAGVPGTPAVFVDGELLQSYDYQSVESAIEDAR